MFERECIFFNTNEINQSVDSYKIFVLLDIKSAFFFCKDIFLIAIMSPKQKSNRYVFLLNLSCPTEENYAHKLILYRYKALFAASYCHLDFTLTVYN